MKIYNNDIEYTRSVEQDNQTLDIAALRGDAALQIAITDEDGNPVQGITLNAEAARLLRDHLNDESTWDALGSAV